MTCCSEAEHVDVHQDSMQVSKLSTIYLLLCLDVQSCNSLVCARASLLELWR